MGINRIVFVLLAICFIPMQVKPDKPDSLLKIIKYSTNELDVAHASVLLAVELLPVESDSAQSLLKSAEILRFSKKDVHKADFYNASGIYYWYEGDFETSIGYFLKTSEMAEKPMIMPHIAKATNNLGCLYSRLGKMDKAKENLERSLQIDSDLGNESGVSKTRYDLGVFHMRQDQYAIALNYLLQAASYQEMINDEARLTYTLIALGNIYLHTGNSEKAIQNYLRVVSLSESHEATDNQITAYNNLSAIFCTSPMDFEHAMYYANKGLVLATQKDDYRNMLALYANIGEAYLSINLPDSALYFFSKARTLTDKVALPIMHAGLYIKLGNVFAMLEDYDSARQYLDKAISISREIESLSFQSDACLKLSEIDSAQGNPGLALSNYRRGIALRDSVWSMENRTRIAELEIQYESAKKEMLINKLEQENRFIRLINIAGIIVVLLFVLVAVILIAYLRKRYIINEQKLIIHKQEHEQILSKLEANKQELTGKALTIVKLEEVIKQFRAELYLLIPQVNEGSARKIKEALNIIDNNGKSQNLWKEFESRFNELNDGFINKLTTLYPGLSPAEIRLCAMLRMQLSSKEIAELSNRSPRTIEYTRTNVRKKMGLNPGDNLTNHLLAI